jgi:hypothetical protein
MITWTKDELNEINSVDELQIASLRGDGTLRKPVTIWVVCVGDEVYIRSVNGREGAWFRGTQSRQEGHICVGGIEKDVTFVDGDPKIRDQVDAAYRAKYRRYPTAYVDSVLTPEAQASTIKLVSL